MTNLWRVKQVKRVRSHYLAHSSIPPLSQLLQQLVVLLPFIRIRWPSIAQMCIKRAIQAEMFLKITTSIKESRKPCIASTHVNAISENPTDSRRARIAIECYLPPSTTTGWKHDPDVSSGHHQATNRRVMHQCTQHGAMLHWLPH